MQSRHRLVGPFAVAMLLSGLLVNVGGLSWAAQPDGAYLTQWLVAGPLDNATSLDGLLEAVGGANARPHKGDSLTGCEGRWMPYQGEGNVINLRENAGYGKSVAAAAFCEFESDTDQPGHIYCAAGNEIHIWLNGQLVLEQSKPDDETLAPTVCDVSLKRGANTCLIVCRSNARWLFGFTLRADGPEHTPAPPLVWNPLVPTEPSVNGSYSLASPDWKWRVGDDPAWAAPGLDDRDWAQSSSVPESGLKPGDVYWSRIAAHFSPSSAMLPYLLLVLPEGSSSEVYVDGVRIYGTGSFGVLFNPFHLYTQTFRFPQECVLAVRTISAGHGQRLPRLAMKRADQVVDEWLDFRLPQRYHRLVLAFCLVSYITYYLFAYWEHPRQHEGVWLRTVLALASMALIVQDMACWTDRVSPGFFEWAYLALVAMAAVSAAAMGQVIGCGSVRWPIVFGYGFAAGLLYLYGWMTDSHWFAFLVIPLITLELLRVWIVYEVIPRHANRRYVGFGLFLFILGQIVSAGFARTQSVYIAGIGPYAYLYGFMALIASMLDYLARESARATRDLKTLTASLEEKVIERTKQVQQLTERLIQSEEAERERLARELHDSVAQTLWFAKMTAENQLPEASDKRQVHDMIGFLDRAIDEVRAIAYGLRPPELDKLGFAQAISHLCKDFSCNTGIPLNYEAHGVDNVALSPVAEVNLYRVLQEALNNVQQHANATNVRVRLVGAFPNVILRVQDNGRGYDAARQRAAMDGNSMGLRSMEERIRLVGGTMDIRTAPGEGTRIVFEVPQQEEQA